MLSLFFHRAVAQAIVLLVSFAWGQVGVIAVAGMAGLQLFKPAQVIAHYPLPITVSYERAPFQEQECLCRLL